MDGRGRRRLGGEIPTTETKAAVLALSENKEKVEEDSGGVVGWRRDEEEGEGETEMVAARTQRRRE